MKQVEPVKETIHYLYNSLKKRENQSVELLDITDVLLQVYKNLETAKNPEALIIRLVNYIRLTSLKGKVTYGPLEEKAMMDLAEFSKRVGLNGSYRADFTDKSQFYSYKEQVIYRH